MQTNRIIIPRNDISIVKSRAVEVPLTGATKGSQNKFLLDEVLNPKGTGSVIFTGMSVYNNTQQVKSNTGRDVVSAADALKICIVMMWGNEEKIYQAPYTDFITQNNYGMIRRLKNLQFSLTNSYILVLDNLANANQSAIVNFDYQPVKIGK